MHYSSIFCPCSSFNSTLKKKYCTSQAYNTICKLINVKLNTKQTSRRPTMPTYRKYLLLWNFIWIKKSVDLYRILVMGPPYEHQLHLKWPKTGAAGPCGELSRPRLVLSLAIYTTYSMVRMRSVHREWKKPSKSSCNDRTLKAAAIAENLKSRRRTYRLIWLLIWEITHTRFRRFVVYWLIPKEVALFLTSLRIKDWLETRAHIASGEVSGSLYSIIPKSIKFCSLSTTVRRVLQPIKRTGKIWVVD